MESQEPLFAHQEAIARRIAAEGRLALFCEQGTGKTRAALEGVRRLADPWPCLIVSPKTVLGVWRREVPRWIGVEPIVVEGTAKKRAELLARPGRIWAINYDALRQANYGRVAVSRLGRKYRVTRNRVADLRRWRVVIADESSRAKHGHTAQAKALHAFADAPHRLILSGTSITHSPLDLWSQFRFLEPDLLPRSFQVFKAPYVISVKRPIPGGVTARGYTHYEQVVGYRDLDQLFALIAPRVARYRKADCLDLPPKLYQEVEVELSDEQRVIYERLAEDLLAQVGDEFVTAASALASLVRLQQVCQGFVVTEDGDVRELGENPKLDALGELMDTVAREGKLVVWCRFLHDVKAALDLAAKLGLGAVKVSGEDATAARDGAVRAFQEDAAIRVFVGQVQAAGFGITLTAATHVAFLSQTWNLDDRLQAEDRAHRIGTRHAVTYVDLVCGGTIDRTIAANLSRKQGFAAGFDRAVLEGMVHGWPQEDGRGRAASAAGGEAQGPEDRAQGP